MSANPFAFDAAWPTNEDPRGLDYGSNWTAASGANWPSRPYQYGTAHPPGMNGGTLPRTPSSHQAGHGLPLGLPMAHNGPARPRARGSKVDGRPSDEAACSTGAAAQIDASTGPPPPPPLPRSTRRAR